MNKIIKTTFCASIIALSLNAFPLSVPLVADSGFGQNWLEAH